MTACGNGELDQGEQCDDAQSNSDSAPDACRTTCRSASCGDGVRDSDEECDDGNFLNADGCSSGCTRDAALWRAVATTGNPSSRAEVAMAYDAARDRTVLFGGWDSSAVLGDAWEYSLQSFWPDENCTNGVDDDLDAPVDCDDPDCYGAPGC
jgi:cysteine-rich repeat protein